MPVSFPGSERCRARPAGSGAGTPGPGAVFDPFVLEERQESERLLGGLWQGRQRRAGTSRGAGGSSGSSLDLITSNTFLTGDEHGVTIHRISAENWGCLKGAALWVLFIVGKQPCCDMRFCLEAVAPLARN